MLNWLFSHFSDNFKPNVHLESTETPPPRTVIGRSDQTIDDDDDVIFVKIVNPIVTDYIDLCSPMPKPIIIPRGSKRTAKDNRYRNHSISVECQDNAVEEPPPKRRKQLICRICFESLCDCSVTMSTSCGHIFCKFCLDQILKVQKRCPLCKHPLNKNRVFRLYL